MGKSLLLLVGFAAHMACAQTAYYISSSSGNDSNAGISEDAPFKTLAKASELRLKPGDKVLLKSGDMWSKESFFPQGSGTPENPITISSYGEGVRPHIAPSFANIYAIRIVNAGGYKISNLEISDCYGGIVTWTERTYDHKYLWIENCCFRDITGKDTRFGGWNSLPTPPDLLYGMGVSICGSVEEHDQTILSDITITNCEFDKCDVGIEVIGRDYDPSGVWDKHGHEKITRNAFKNVNIMDCNVRRSYRTGGVMLYCINGGVAKNVLIDETGYQDVGMWWGVAAFQCARVANYLIDGCTFSNTIKGNSPDGQGFDFESDCQNITVRNSKFLYNDGPAILWFGGTWKGSNYGNIVENCYFEGNNRKRAYDDATFMVWHADNEGIIRNSEIRLANESQTFYSYPIVFDSSNKVYAPDGTLIHGATNTTAPFFADDFSNGLEKWATPETGKIADGALTLPANVMFKPAKTANAKDYYFEADIALDTLDAEAGLVFKMRSDKTYWLAKLVQKGGHDSYIDLLKRDENGETNLRRIPAVGMRPKRFNKLRVEVIGETVKILLDGSLHYKVQDDSASSDSGFALWTGSKESKTLFKNVKAGKVSRLL